MIKVEHISKSYGKVKALQDISFEVSGKEIFGIIGPDGAGKSTLFRILTTLILADQGSVHINGLDSVKNYRTIRNNIGYMPGKFSLYQDLSVEENLKFFVSIFNTTIEENYRLIKDIYKQLEPFKNRRAGALSGGMKQKLALSCALIHKPDILFLDEPTTGVDPVSRKEFWDMLQELKKEGIVILVSTSYMDEAGLCDRIALIQKGKFLTVNTPQNIVNEYTELLWAVSSEHMSKLLTDLRKHPEIKTCYAFGDVHHITTNQTFTNNTQADNFSNDIKQYLENSGHTNIVLHTIQASVEDCFMKLAEHTNEESLTFNSHE